MTLSIIGEYPFKEAWIGGVSARCLRLDVVSSVPGSQIKLSTRSRTGQVKDLLSLCKISCCWVMRSMSHSMALQMKFCL